MAHQPRSRSLSLQAANVRLLKRKKLHVCFAAWRSCFDGAAARPFPDQTFYDTEECGKALEGLGSRRHLNHIAMYALSRLAIHECLGVQSVQ